MLERDENDERLVAAWNEVQAIAPTDDDALDVFYSSWQELGLIRCGDCASTRIDRQPGEREGKCDDCGQTCWVTSGTVLHRASLFKGYLAAATFFEKGLSISGPNFCRLTGIPQTSSYTILRKLRFAINNQMPADASEFSGRLVGLLIAKRTLETPAKCHPFAEQKAVEEALRADDSQSNVDLPDVDLNQVSSGADEDDQNLSDYERVKKGVANLLSDVGMTADTFSLITGFAIGKVTASLSELELFGEARVEPGGKYFKIAQQNKPKVGESISKSMIEALCVFVDFVDVYFHRIGRKGIQTYVAALWCIVDRERWGKGTMLRLCGEHPPIHYCEIRDYVSPPLLKIMVS